MIPVIFTGCEYPQSFVVGHGDSDPVEGATCLPSPEELPTIASALASAVSLQDVVLCCVSWLEKESPILGTRGWSNELLITVRLEVLRVGNNMDKQSFRLPQRDPRRNNFEKFTMSKLLNTRELTCCFREGNGTPFQYSCLENPVDRSLVGCSPWNR